MKPSYNWGVETAYFQGRTGSFRECNFGSSEKKHPLGGFKYFLFSPLLGEMIQFDEHIFQMGWNHQLAQYFKDVATFSVTKGDPPFG